MLWRSRTILAVTAALMAMGFATAAYAAPINDNDTVTVVGGGGGGGGTNLNSDEPAALPALETGGLLEDLLL
ncbi:MAG: hypothetical protein ACRD0K_04885 [Egibacteraceae bacterium]